MKHYLWALRPYFRQVAGELLLGSLAGILMNSLVVLPAILLGRAIDMVLAFERGQATAAAVAWAGLAFLGGTLATAVPRMGKRWWLIIAHCLATARAADRVIVLDAGRIVEEGAPEQLIEQGGRFAAMLELEAAG